MIITKSSSIAKLTDADITIFSKVCEKGINELTNKNTEFTNDFKLTKEQADYRLAQFQTVANLEQGQFAKGAISDQFAIAVQIIGKKVFFKCYQDGKLVLEIGMSKNQLDSLEDKYYYDLQRFDGSEANQTYHIFLAATFFVKDASGMISTKLSDLRMLKFVNVLDI